MVPYTLITGSKNISSWSLRGYLAMRVCGAEFQQICIPLHTPATHTEILRYSPSGKVPALQFTEKDRPVTVWDSLAICETLAERHPEAKMWPEDTARRAMARSYAAEMHTGYPEIREHLSMDLCHDHPTPEMTPALSAEIRRLFDAWRTALKCSGGPFLFGAWSIADIMYAPMTFRLTGYSVPHPPEIAAYVLRVQSRPDIQDWRNAARKEEENTP